MDISFVIVNWNTKNLLLDCLKSIYETVKDISFEIFVVDNASTDGSVEALAKKYPDVIIIRNSKNLGFAKANNKAFKIMKGRYALLLNTDTVLMPGAVKELFDFMESDKDAAIACGQLLNPDGSKQNSIANFPSLLTFVLNEAILRILFPEKFPSKLKNYKNPIEIDSGIGACLIVRKSAMDEVGFFDESYFFFFEETDWALRMKKAGWKIFFVPSAKIIHKQGQSVGHNLKSRKLFYTSRYIYLKKWHGNLFNILKIIIIFRLYVNASLNLAGTVFTLGLEKNIKQKFYTYSKLLIWHFEKSAQNSLASIITMVSLL